MIQSAFHASEFTEIISMVEYGLSTDFSAAAPYSKGSISTLLVQLLVVPDPRQKPVLIGELIYLCLFIGGVCD